MQTHSSFKQAPTSNFTCSLGIKQSLWYYRKTNLIKVQVQLRSSARSFLLAPCVISPGRVTENECCSNPEMLKGPTKSSGWKAVKHYIFKTFFSIVFWVGYVANIFSGPTSSFACSLSKMVFCHWGKPYNATKTYMYKNHFKCRHRWNN